MKAISLRQPWADLVVQGKKILELRSWTVSYRGPLAIHASQNVNETACHVLGLRADQVTAGALVGMVELVDIHPMDAAAFKARAGEHLAEGFFSPPGEDTRLYGWELAGARVLPQPIPYHGRMGLFNVPDALLEQGEDLSPEAADFLPAALDWDTRQPFELRVVPENGKAPGAAAYRLAVYQRIVEPPPAQGRMAAAAPVEMRLVAELGNSTLKAVADQVLDALRSSGYPATDLTPSRREPFLLSEESGVRLGLLFLAVRPISKMNRVEAISTGIRAMPSEELYYWFSKCAGTPHAERALKALRILLSDV